MRVSDSLLAGRFGTALVTGASSGIGSAIASALLQQGLKVYGTTRNPDRTDLTRDVRWLSFEGASESGLLAFIDNNAELLSNIDILVNNSGSSYFGRAPEIPAEAKERQHQLLFKTPVRLTGAVLPQMRSRRSGAIVNVSSLASLFPIPYLEDYSASKRQLSDWTRRLIEANRETGVVIIDFQPGDYRTNFNINLKRYGGADPESDTVWRHLERHLQAGPAPEKAADDVIRALRSGRSATVRSGTFFQSRVAPAGWQVLPRRLVEWAIRKYYGI